MARIQPDTGFTLIEILLVVAIIGILALIMIPTFSSHEDEQKLTMATTELVDGLRYARSEAISSGNNHQVIINKAINEFKLIDSTNPKNLIYHPASKKDYSVSFSDSSPFSGVDIAGTNTMSITFYANGLTDADAKICLNYGVYTTNLFVDSMTGNIDIE
jgi:prepilin-type N-terminal cleavage/methylation domain-containing protein